MRCSDLLRGTKYPLSCGSRVAFFYHVFFFKLQPPRRTSHASTRDHLPRRFLPRRYCWESFPATLLGKGAIFGGLQKVTFLRIENTKWTPSLDRFQSEIEIVQHLSVFKEMHKKIHPWPPSLKNYRIRKKKIYIYIPLLFQYPRRNRRISSHDF